MSVRTVLAGGRVFDGTGADLSDADVAIQDGRIVAIGPGLDGDRAIDLTGKTLLPGFINTHVHVVGTSPSLEERLRTPFSYQFFQAIPILEHLLSCGFTYARDLAGADHGVKRAVEAGLVKGPKLQVSIQALSPTGGHIDAWLPSGQEAFEYYIAHPMRHHGVVDGPDEIQLAIRELVRAGADVIKICTTNGGVYPRKDYLPAHFRDDELATVMTEARNAGRPVASHAHGVEGVKNAVRAGVDSIEHGTYLDDEAIELMVEHGTYLVPTLTRFLAPLERADVAERLGAERLEHARAVADACKDSFSKAVAAGVKIAMGTDMHGGEFLDELFYMNRHGLTAQETLAATTSAAADLMRLSDAVGTIAIGKRADVVVLEGDPFDFADMRKRVHTVYQDGIPTWVGQAVGTEGI